MHEPGFLEKKEEKQGLTLGRGLYTQIYNCRVRSTCVCSQTTRDSQEARRPQRNMATGSTTGSRLAVAVVRKAGASHMEMKDITQGRLTAMSGHFSNVQTGVGCAEAHHGRI